MNAKSPAWVRLAAHVIVLLKLLLDRIVISAVLVALIIGFMAYMRGGMPSWENIMAAIVGYTGAFMINFYLQFAHYRDDHVNLSSEKASTVQEMVAALDAEYKDMLRRQASGKK